MDIRAMQYFLAVMAFMGIVGAVLFGVGDWLIYLYPGLALQNDIQLLWAEMPAWRFIGSAWCGIIGGMIMMYGAYSAYVAMSIAMSLS